MTTPVERPADSAGELYRRTDISPEEIFQAIERLRKEARDEIERLLDFLDKTDDHMEREPDLSFPENHHDQSQTEIEDGLCGTTDDREIDGDELDASYPERSDTSRLLAHPNEDDEADGDDEPSLGSIANGHWHDQIHWAHGNRDEREGDGCADDREGDELMHGGESVHENDEPSLGWTDEEAARGRMYAGSMGHRADYEHGPSWRRPQHRTIIAGAGNIVAVTTYRRFLHGVPPEQKAVLNQRMRRRTDVSLQ